jgi:hypothetical protein
MIDEKFLNPFGIDPSVELPHARQPVPNWTEYCYFFGYDADAGLGVSIHIGREPTDINIWRGTLGIYLPNGELLVAKYFGRDGSDRGPGAGPLQVRCIVPFRTWSVEFNGLATPVSRKSIMTEALKDAPAELASFHLVFEGVGPFWDSEKGNRAANQPGIVLDFEKSESKRKELETHHWEQIGMLRGAITARGKTTQIVGGGVRDHSHGARDYWPIIGSTWANAVFPSGKVFNAVFMRMVGREIKFGYIFRNDGTPLEVVKLIEHPDVVSEDTPARSVAADPMTDDKLRRPRYVVETANGREVLEGELLHAMGTTYLSPNFELVGTDLARVKGGSQLAECAARYTWNGEVGVGVNERIARVITLRPD